MSTGLTLVCPVRGPLKAKARSADGLRPSEERLRVEAIRHVIARGYPKENIHVEAVIKRFGNSGRNSFRADFIVLDRPAGTVKKGDVDALLKHSVVLAEVKRDNAQSTQAVSYQVRPMLDFAARTDCVALYWDDVEQRVYWHIRDGVRKVLQEGPLADLPGYGQRPGAKPLTFNNIDPNKSLLAVFERVEDILHSASIGPSKRFQVMMQILLAKLYDEQQHASTPDAPLTVQDFAALDVPPEMASSTMNRLLKKAVTYYQAFLPEPVESKFPITGEVMLDVMRVVAPIKIVSMRQNVIQDFYMYFARHIYKWDLAQYFTPTSVTEFIVEILNPQFSEHIKDPACGSADFLTAAFRRGQHWPDYASSVWGSDVSQEAVQVAVLNMILNGDGKTNIRREDSLLKITSNLESCDIVICNPPFGTKIVERNSNTLKNFDLGHEWEADEFGRWRVTDRIVDKQESGILFAEACVRMLRPKGRFALVVPNGYLGNRSQRYYLLREWLLRHCRISVIVGLPRFTFKGSGADVSASVIFCEKREEPLRDARESEDYEFCVETIDRVGWRLGDKKGEPAYRRDPADGTYIISDDGQLVLDSDFEQALQRIRNSSAAQFYPWLIEEVQDSIDDGVEGWTVSIKSILDEEYLTLDPKRNCQKMGELRKKIAAKRHFRLGDVVDFLPEGFNRTGKRATVDPSKDYRLIEISDIGIGTYRWQVCKGWELPQRAKHHAEPGDIYIGSIWSSVTKWFLASKDCSNTVVTNGLHRLRLKPEHEELLLDLVVGLCSEAYATQMRGFARGSDGLAEIPPEDVAGILLPLIEDEATRREIQPFVDQLIAGHTSIEATVSHLASENRLEIPAVPPRPHHTAII